MVDTIDIYHATGVSVNSSSRRPLHRQPVLLRQFLQRHLRPCADVLDHFGCRERTEPADVLMTGAAHQAEQESGGEQGILMFISVMI